MQTRRTAEQYRAIDLSLFALMLMVFETVIVRAATGWFPAEAWTVSVVPAVTVIVMVRWGPWCAIHAALGGVVTVLAMKAGLDSAILDPTNRDMMGVIFATEALLGLDDYCMEYISAYREGLFGPKKD